MRPSFSLSANAKLGDERSVSLDVVTPEIVEHPAAAPHEHQQAPLGVKVLLVDLHVRRQVTDAIGEERNLDLGRPSVGVVQLVFVDRGGRVGHALVKTFVRYGFDRTSYQVRELWETPAVRLDHLGLFVADRGRAADWYVSVLGLQVEFEGPEIPMTAVVDDGDFTIFLSQRAEGVAAPAPTAVLTFRVESVDATYEQLSARGVAFRNAPQVLPWGYGAELVDPDGNIVCLWDEVTMKAHSAEQ